ncbi:hypothetical protein [Flavobacterium sp. KACC 22763]|uniref:hypothetical protein n=1 Tax=Flavobacterium sp. KACC 22763 TaxID=3025668 RepID=UPI0023652014|nr:hypothetical protein [Flavobacterium sp. KACC 22763]WDF64910.1 hypothetical protein PQ463_01890 [Flavobacterium sp. KACC 22763]
MTKIYKKNSVQKWTTLLIASIALIALFYTNIFANIFSLIIEKEYFIPKQSSIFTFKETIQNDGSSDVWRYGEDCNNYYYNLSTFHNDVLFFPKNKTKSCPGFNSKNVTTWCGVKI